MEFASGGQSLTVTDGITTISNVGEIVFSGATVTSGGSGIADVTIMSSGGTVTSVSVVTANGFSGTVANPTTTPAITIIAGAITPTSVNGLTITSTTGTLTIASGKTLTVDNTLTFTGTDSSSVAFGTGGTVLYGNQTITLSGDVTGSGATAITTTVAKIAGTTVSGTTGSTNVVFSTSPTLSNPTVGTQLSSDNSTLAASTAYVTTAVTNALNGLDWKPAVGYATTANVIGTNVAGVFTYTSTGVDTIDGHQLALNDVVLFKNQTTQADNGVWVVTTAGAIGIAGVLTRRSDYNTAADIHNGDTFYVQNGTVNVGTAWVQTATVNTINVDPLTFSQVAGPGTYVAGTGLTLTGNSFSVNASQTQITAIGTITTGTLSTGAVIGGVTMMLGSDATGDIYYRNSSGILTRLGIGNSSQVLHGGTIPSYSAVSLTADVSGVLPIANGGTNSPTALNNTRIMVSSGGAIVESNTINNGQSLQRNGNTFQTLPIPVVIAGRLTLTTGVPITTGDVTGAATVYFTPYKGNIISTYNATNWVAETFSEVNLALTISITTCVTTNGSKIVTGISGGYDTRKLVRGMKITGTNIAANSVISTIDGNDQITMNNNATGSGTTTLTFKVPASTNYDLFWGNSFNSMQFGNAWTNDTTRADALTTQDGIYVNNATINSGDFNQITAKTGVYLGTIRITTTDGQTEDSFGGASQAGGHRYVWNNYNRFTRAIGVIDTTNSWTYTTDTFRQANGATGNKVEYVVGLSEDLVEVNGKEAANNNSGVAATCGIGVDSTSTNSAQIFGGLVASFDVTSCEYSGYPGIGYHALNWLESSNASGTTTWYGDDGLSDLQSGIIAYIQA